MVVIHYTAMTCPQAALRVLCDPAREVSAHYLITPAGTVYALVPEQARAWHAGVGRWGDVTDVNSHAIGIELSNDGASPFAAAQIDALEALLAGIMQRWHIPPARVIGHSDMAPGRKIDPGLRFDWQRLARNGLAIWPKPTQPAPPTAFAELMWQAGYRATQDADLLLDSLRRRYRPWGHGPLGPMDMAIITDIAARYPVDATADAG
jgi:N-acetylmuramoyl-L-alanine amidase